MYNGTNIRNYSTNHSTFAATSLLPGVTYNITIKAIYENGNISNGIFYSETTLPSPVKNLVVISVSDNSVTLEWTFSSDPNNISYTYTVDGGGSNKMIDIKKNTTEMKNLTAGTDYNFTVFAVTANGIYSTSSDIANATTQPSTVQGVDVLSVSETTVTLHWNFSKDINKDTYTYAVDGKGEHFNNVSYTKNNAVVIEQLLPGVDYTFAVRAVTKNNIDSQASKPVHATTMPNAPRNLQGHALNVSEIYINWTAPGDINEKLYDYMVTWEDMKVSQKDAANKTTKDTNLSIENLLPGHLYKITVRSVIKNTSSANAELYTVTKPPPTYELKASKINRSSVTLIWNIINTPHSFVSGYRVTVYSNGTEKLQKTTNEAVFVADKLDPGTFYFFVVESYAQYTRPGTTNRMVTEDNITSYSTPSTFEADTDPAPVHTFSCSKVDAYRIKVDFLCPLGNYSSFEVLVNNASRGRSLCPSDFLISNLQPAASYRISVMTVATNKSAFSDVIICDTDNTGVIVGSIFGILLFLLLIALIVFFVLRKRRSKGGSENIPNTTFRRRFHTIPRDKFKQHYENNHADSDFGFAEEYQELNTVGTTQSKRGAELPENRAKNRFTNVLPYDHSRVKLSIMNGMSTSDYINANYMPGYNSTKEFIASQGPLPNTTADFWRMIWEHQVNTILMLTNCMENGRVKCEHYWPLDYTPCTYGDITVTVTSETILSEWTIRDFSVKHANQPGIKYVRHFHYTAWPDHGVPDSTSSIIQFRNLVREHMDQRKSNGPTVVHCSAGVGRTGTLIAMDYLIQQMEREQRIGIYGFVEKMRMNRNLMVQTEAQYIFLNKCMLDLIDQPGDENIYENPTGPEMVYENISAIQNLQREHV